MVRYVPTLLSVICASAFAFLSLPQAFPIPATAFGKVGFICVAVTLGILTVLPAYVAQKTAERNKVRAENLYNNLGGRLRPLLLQGLEEMLKRIANAISERLSDELDGENPSFFIFMKADTDRWVVAASNVDKAALVRRIALSDDEGIVGFTSNVRARLLANGPVSQELFDHRDNRNLGKQTPLRPDNLAKCDRGVAWIFAEPIFVTVEGKPWDQTVIGVLTVDSKNENGNEFFRQAAFVELVDAISEAASPYLGILKEIPEL